MVELWIEGIKFLIGLACFFGTTYFVIWLIAVLNKMFSD